MRRAWIERLIAVASLLYCCVALHAESVDRKHRKRNTSRIILQVALHAESVDRNIYILQSGKNHFVALHAESVDRNTRGSHYNQISCVALHAESVDRNERL